MKHKLSFLPISCILFVFCIFYGIAYFYLVPPNYSFHREHKKIFVEHPEFIPKSELVKIGASGFQAIIADGYWLEAIQYIGKNALSSQYKPYLGAMLQFITDLSPHFTEPYQIGLLLLPEYNPAYENTPKEKQAQYTAESITLGEKGIKNTCDTEKINKILAISDLKKLYSDPSLTNPCTNPLIPYYLAYIAHWNEKNSQKASDWYKITGTHTNGAPAGAKILSAIMQGKGGNREKAILMFLDIAQTLPADSGGLCQTYTSELGKLLYGAFQSGRVLNEPFLREVEKLRKEAETALKMEASTKEMVDIQHCGTYLDKAVREMNLFYLETADLKYFHDHGLHAPNAQELYGKKYISYIPQDPQKSLQKDVEMEYIYDFENGNWDAKFQSTK